MRLAVVAVALVALALPPSAASYVKPRIVVPMHFGTFPALAGTPQELEAALKGKAKVLVMEPGKATPL